MTDDRRATRPRGPEEAAGETSAASPTAGEASGESAAGSASCESAAGSAGKCIVVVGGGLAGLRTCQELRAQGFTGELHLVRAEAGPPYDRPPLSKGRHGHLDADLPIDLAPLDLHDHPATRAIGLVGADPNAQPGSRTPLSVRLAVAEPSAGAEPAATELLADVVIAASGAHPILPAAWVTSPNVRVLRTRDDAAALWNTLDAAGPDARVAVLGGSWIGLEFATAAVDADFDVSVFERAPQLLPLLPPEAGGAVQRWCDEAGVTVYLGAAVESVNATPSRISVTTAATASVPTDTDTVPVIAVPVTATAVTASTDSVDSAAASDSFDVVLVGLGVAPTTDWLADSGLARTPTGALRVDAHLRSSDHRIIGVGDCVERWSPRYQTWLPGGHWQDARDQPVVAAASALAALTTPADRFRPTPAPAAGTSAPATYAPATSIPAPATPAAPATSIPAPATPAYDAVPYFWSEMFGHTLQFSGYVPDPTTSRIVVRGNLDEPSWTLAWLDDRDRLQALLACDRPRDAITARKILAADPNGLPTVDPTALADPQTPLAQCTRSHEGARP